MELNGITLAYLGDSIYEYYVRKHLIDIGIRHVNRLHHTATNYTRAISQSLVMNKLIEENYLSEAEIRAFKLGRNSNARQAKKTCSVIEYKMATGFEALIAYLDNDRKRQLEVINESFRIIESENLK